MLLSLSLQTDGCMSLYLIEIQFERAAASRSGGRLDLKYVVRNRMYSVTVRKFLVRERVGGCRMLGSRLLSESDFGRLYLFGKGIVERC